jgi:hypothetical protein
MTNVEITPEMILIIIVLIGAILIVFSVCLVVVCYRRGGIGTAAGGRSMKTLTANGEKINPNAYVQQQPTYAYQVGVEPCVV